MSFALTSLSMLLSLLAGKVEVSTSNTCSSLANVGSTAVLAASWDTNHLKQPSANPLNCFIITGFPTSQLTVGSLPSGYTITATPDGTGYTSTVTVSGGTVTMTVPTTFTTNSWTMNIKNASGAVQVSYTMILTNATVCDVRTALRKPKP
ncbi:MAG: hypothetical protein IAG13_24805 [Deltaproteobacteria bacterium]|nr:hypothetical protein [Nannocystaceae bacterium]